MQISDNLGISVSEKSFISYKSYVFFENYSEKELESKEAKLICSIVNLDFCYNKTHARYLCNALFDTFDIPESKGKGILKMIAEKYKSRTYNVPFKFGGWHTPRTKLGLDASILEYVPFEHWKKYMK